MLSQWIQKQYLDANTINTLSQLWKLATPFSYLQLQNFFNEKKLLLVLQALAGQEFEKKESDLFKFSQTHELSHTKDVVLREFISFLYSKEFKAYMAMLTSLAFGSKVDIHGTLYEDTDFLLCHDDELDGRNIAFLCYLSTLTESQGGTLDLFENENGRPVRIAKSLLPTFNSFTFFHVTPISFHQVSEVTADTQRVAIGGWYHAQ